jgi:DNA-binding SARP family transcriptional activator/tetratricopeptide (TPR) repeat protein
VLRISLIGRLRVQLGGDEVPLGSAQQRVVLAWLALSATKLVPLEEIIEVLWGTQPPPSATNTVRTYVKRLRRLLEPDRAARSTSELIPRVGGGYSLQIDPEAVDVLRARRLIVDARACRQRADWRGVRALLAEVFTGWSEPLLTDLPALRDHPRVAGVSGMRREAVDLDSDAAVALGQSADIIPRLVEVARAEPFDELVHARLIHAHRLTGHRAAAMAVYRDITRRLAEELGVDPGPELADAYRSLLAGAVTGDAPAPEPAPPPEPESQLPADVTDFVGRTAEIDRIASLILAEIGGETAPVVTLSGPPGVGKTALAVRIARRLRADFPDGQLYVDLRGYSSTPPMRPGDVLVRFLRVLGVSRERIGVDLDDQSSTFRAVLAGRRILLLLDNAAAADQVRPLLPGNAGCAVIVTSRDNLHGLIAINGARRVQVGTLGADDAVRLLSKIIGPAVSAEPEAAHELARLCGGLPLALRIGAAHLAATPGLTLAAYAHRLRSERPFSALAVDGDGAAAVHLAFDLSFRTLKPDLARLFHLVSLIPGCDFDRYAAANIAGIGVIQARAMLDSLAAANLIQQCGPDRYEFHDLIKEYARNHAGDGVGERERSAAYRRLFDFYLHTACDARSMLHAEVARMTTPEPPPGLLRPRWAGPGEALAWFNAEMANLVAFVQYTPVAEVSVPVWFLADAMLGYLGGQQLDAVAIATFDIARVEAEKAGDLAAHAAMCRGLAKLEFVRCQFSESDSHYSQAWELFRRIGDPAGEARVLVGLGSVAVEVGRYHQAIARYRNALQVLRELNDLAGEADALSNLGVTLCMIGQAEEGLTHLTAAMRIASEVGLPHVPPRALSCIGLVDTWEGRLVDARLRFEEALLRWRDLEYQQGVAQTLRNLAEIHLEAGRPRPALVLAEQALDLANAIDARWMTMGALATLGHAWLDLGDVDAARTHLMNARRLAGNGLRYWRSSVAAGLAACHRVEAQYELALALASEALDDPRPRYAGRAHAELARIHLCRGDYGAAMPHAGRWQRIAEQYGYRLDLARSLRLLAEIHRGLGNGRAAGIADERARTIFDLAQDYSPDPDRPGDPG